MSDIKHDDLKKTPDSYLIFELGYRKFVFKYDVGLEVLKLFKHAEYADHQYGEGYIIRALDKTESPEIKVLSEYEYLAGKMSHLLGVNVDPDSMNELKVVHDPDNKDA